MKQKKKIKYSDDVVKGIYLERNRILKIIAKYYDGHFYYNKLVEEIKKDE